RNSTVTLRLLIFPQTVAAVVEDDGPGFRTVPPVPDERSTHGWGLHLVFEQADRFGIETSPRTAVWFELERAPAPVPVAGLPLTTPSAASLASTSPWGQ